MSQLLSLEIAGKRIFLRCDLNVPIRDGAITDDGRIRASLPTINFLLDGGASIIIGAHLGRPKGEVNPALSLAPVAKRLGELLGREIQFSGQVIGDSVVATANNLRAGQVFLLENLRFISAETSKDGNERGEFARKIAALVEGYVGDGFGAVHRKHASVFDLPKLLPHAPGFLISAEVEILKKLTHSPLRPYGVVLGGAKVSEKIGVISNLIEKVDLLAIGGGMAFTFLAAQGRDIGNSLVERDLIESVKELISRAAEKGVELLLPTDIVVGATFSADATPTLVDVGSIPKDQMGMDIGPVSAETFSRAIMRCQTVFWNGPMGVFEFPNFAAGTKVIAEALTKVAGISVVGGGDSAAAVRALGFADSDFGYISTGGGASLEYLEGKELPGLQALDL